MHPLKLLPIRVTSADNAPISAFTSSIVVDTTIAAITSSFISYHTYTSLIKLNAVTFYSTRLTPVHYCIQKHFFCISPSDFHSTPSPSVQTLHHQSSSTARPPQCNKYSCFPYFQHLMERKPYAIGKAITLVESSNPLDSKNIGDLLRAIHVYNEEKEVDDSDKFLDEINGQKLFKEQLQHGSKENTVTDEFMPVLKRDQLAMHYFLAQECQQEDFEWSIARRRSIIKNSRSNRPSCMRITVSGSPGAGKSCFIEALGMLLVERYHLNVGVICVDPSSSVSGGSILGDKTRMDKLSNLSDGRAFVRPSPTRGHLGGVTARCWESMEILEGIGYDVILIETVGVGQSEIAARTMTDLFILLVPPAAGDDLQGIKKGIVEIADIVVVTKNDGDKKLLAQQTKAAYSRAVMFQKNHFPGMASKPHVSDKVNQNRSRTIHYDSNCNESKVSDEDVMIKGENIHRESTKHQPLTLAQLLEEVDAKHGIQCNRTLLSYEYDDTLKPVMAISSEESPESIDLLWRRIDTMWGRRRASGMIRLLRKNQVMNHFNEYIVHELIQRALKSNLYLGKELMERMEDLVVERKISPREAGDQALEKLFCNIADTVMKKSESDDPN
eukprot:Tbor_TRINITY_DN4732_c0_g1::TRINITY_DN4732_c0_g1_i1::g.16937::m.16937/K07588/argK; LAO/AO transport system kinase